MSIESHPLELQNRTQAEIPSDEGIDLFEIFTLIAVQWRRILLTAAIAFVLGVVLILNIQPLFEASASLLPQSKVQAAGLASVLTGSASPGTIFIGLLKSRAVADEVIDSQHLMQAYKVKSREEAQRILASRSVFSVGTDTMVSVKVRDENAEGAKRLNDAYLKSLEDQRGRMLQDEAAVQDRFFEEQIQKEAGALANAEQALQQVQESTGVLQPMAQTVFGLASIDSLRTSIASLKVQLASLRLGESDQNPQVKELQAQIGALLLEERTRESAKDHQGAGAAASAKNMPQLNLDFARKERDVKYHEVLLTSIATHYETARLSGASEIEPYVIVDRGVVPERKAWPPRLLLLIADLIFSFIIGLVAASFHLLWRKLLSDPAQVQRLDALRDSFRFTR
jgi:tyrosine-protein kinase Etk/Wzc